MIVHFSSPIGHKSAIIIFVVSIQLIHLSDLTREVMQQDQRTEHFLSRARETLTRSGRIRRGQTTRSVMRFASVMAVNGALSVGRRAGAGARDAVEGAVHALGAMGGETRSFVRDAVIGVFEGSAQVMTVTAPSVREIVVGGIRGTRRLRSGSADTGRDVVAGAIVGAESIGLDDTEAVTAVVEGAVEGFAEVGSELSDAARSTIRGVVSGVSATGGDVATSTRDATTLLIARTAAREATIPRITEVAVSAIDAVFLEACRSTDVGNEVMIAAATGVVGAAYRIDRRSGDSVREAVMLRVAEPSINLPPRVRRRLPQIQAQLQSELSRSESAWRGRAIVKAIPLLYSAGGVDLAASLAYFTMLSIFPLMALMIMGIALLSDPETIQTWFVDTLVHYFPASRDLIQQAVGSLFSGYLAFGLVAIVSILVGANGMFRATRRAVNRVFGIDFRSVIRATLMDAAVATLFGIMFLLSIFMTAFLHTAINFSQDFAVTAWSISNLIAILLGLVSTLLPIAVTALIFAIIYHHLPNTHVDWRDATFGSLIAIVLFEIGKHVFFWFITVVSQGGAVYGPVASFVVLLMWAYIAGLIFLYGAAVTKVSSDIRPRGFLTVRPLFSR